MTKFININFNILLQKDVMDIQSPYQNFGTNLLKSRNLQQRTSLTQQPNKQSIEESNTNKTLFFKRKVFKLNVSSIENIS